MKIRPYIGISMRLTRHRIFKNTFIHGIPQDYVNAVSSMGAIPVLLPVLEQGPVLKEMLSLVDGIIISGSDSYISPNLWGEEGDPEALQLCPQSRIETEFDLSLLRYSWCHGLPVLGICQGHELINIALGGTLKGSVVVGEWLNQKKLNQKKSLEPFQIAHDCRINRPKDQEKLNQEKLNQEKFSCCGEKLGSSGFAVGDEDRTHHQIEILRGSQLAEILLQESPSCDGNAGESCLKHSRGKLLIQVNSFHGLAVGRLASCLEATAFAEDGTIEAIEWRKDLRERYPFLLGVQWHPEMLLYRRRAVSIKTHIPMQGIFTRLVEEAESFRCGKRHRVICFETEDLSFLPHSRFGENA